MLLMKNTFTALALASFRVLTLFAAVPATTVAASSTNSLLNTIAR